MTYIQLIIALLLGTNFVNSGNTETITKRERDQGDIAVFVDNVQVHKGPVYIGLFNSKKTFRKIDKVYRVEVLKGHREEGVVVIEDVPYDDYAIVVFQDYNENKKFDKNFMGIPKEPFGFSTNFQVSTRAPKYKEVLFNHKEEETELQVNLQIY